MKSINLQRSKSGLDFVDESRDFDVARTSFRFEESLHRADIANSRKLESCQKQTLFETKLNTLQIEMCETKINHMQNTFA